MPHAAGPKQRSRALAICRDVVALYDGDAEYLREGTCSQGETIASRNANGRVDSCPTMARRPFHARAAGPPLPDAETDTRRRQQSGPGVGAVDGEPPFIVRGKAPTLSISMATDIWITSAPGGLSFWVMCIRGLWKPSQRGYARR